MGSGHKLPSTTGIQSVFPHQSNRFLTAYPLAVVKQLFPHAGTPLVVAMQLLYPKDRAYQFRVGFLP
jgi:hypothetical protein